jgi:hypothetical protein
MTNMKKTFFTKFLLATSSIGLLASAEGFAVDIIAAGNPSSNIATMNDWRYNNNYYLPQNNDNIIITENHRVNFTQAININNINLYGFNGVFTIIADNPTNKVSINNITNVNNPQTQMAVQNALGAPFAYGGNNNAKAKLKLTSGNGTGSELTITGNDIRAVESIELIRASTKLIFQRAITVDAPIYSCSANRGIIEVKDDVTFEKAIGLNGKQSRSIYELQVNDDKSATLKSDIYATNINLGRGSALIVNPLAQDINVQSGISIARDNDNIIRISGNKNNKVTFYQDIGARNNRVSEIDIRLGKEIHFESEVYAKKIKVAISKVEFKTKLDMQHNNGGVIDTGNLELASHTSKVKIHQEFNGNITAAVDNRGEVTFVETPDIYEIGSQNKKVNKVTFEGVHAHNLHNDIHANTVELDAGTYTVRANPVTIGGNANINGSTLNLKNNLILNGNVEFSGNIRINATGGYGIVFHNNNLPSVIQGTNIILNVNGDFPPNDAAALSMFRLNNGEEFIPVAYNYENATGTFTLPQGLQAQQPGVQAAAQPTHALVRADATTVGNVILTRETVDTLGQREALLQQDRAAVPNRVQRQVDRENLRLRQAQNTLAQIQADNPQQLAEAQQRLNAARAGADIGEQNRAQQAFFDARNAVVVAQQALNEAQREVPAQIIVLQREGQDRQREIQQQIDNIALELVQARQDQVDAEAQANRAGLVVPADAQAQQQAAAQAQALAEQQRLDAQAAAQAQALAEQQRLDAQAAAQAQALAEQQRLDAQAAAQAQALAEQQRLDAQAAAQAQALAEQQRLDAQAAAQAQQNQQGQGQGQAQQQQQGQAQQDQPQAQVGQEDNVRGEQAPLQTQQRIVEVVPQPRPELANVIASVASPTVSQEVRVIQAQKEVIREKSALVMKNPEKHAVELAKELVSNQAELKEAVKVASDDTVVASKTKQEQSLLFVANLANAAQGTPNKGKEIMQRSADQGTRLMVILPKNNRQKE